MELPRSLGVQVTPHARKSQPRPLHCSGVMQAKCNPPGRVEGTVPGQSARNPSSEGVSEATEDDHPHPELEECKGTAGL